MTDLSGMAHVMVNDQALGMRKVTLTLGELSWPSGTGSEDLEPLGLWSANGVKGMGNRVIVVFEGGMVVTLEVSAEDHATWLAALSAWVPEEDATKQLLKRLAAATKRGGGGGNVVDRRIDEDGPTVLQGRARRYEGTPEELLADLREAERRADLLMEDKASTREALETTQFLFQEADQERSELRRQLQSVKDAVRLKNVGMLISRNTELGNLKLKVDMYEEQIGFLVSETERLKSQGKQLLQAKQGTVRAVVEVLQEARDQMHAYRCLLYGDSARRQGLDVSALVAQSERLRRALFFTMCSHLRLARSLSASSGEPLPDAYRLYQQYSALPEERWRQILCDAFHVQLDLLTPELAEKEGKQHHARRRQPASKSSSKEPDPEEDEASM